MARVEAARSAVGKGGQRGGSVLHAGAVEARVRLQEVVLRMNAWVSLPRPGTCKALDKFVDGTKQAAWPLEEAKCSG